MLGFMDTHYRFITIDVGSYPYGRNSDGNVFAKSILEDALDNKGLHVPEDTPQKKRGIYAIRDEDEAFPRKSYIMIYETVK